MTLSAWHLRHGTWWMVQWTFDWWFSVGVHVDLRHRRRADGRTFGPYVDLHLGFVILSAGWRPWLSGEIEKEISVSRGGL